MVNPSSILGTPLKWDPPAPTLEKSGSTSNPYTPVWNCVCTSIITTM